jgi:hypothetical protein
VQIAESAGGRRRIVAHVGSAHTEAELGILLERAREMLADPAQGSFDLGIEAAAPQARLVPPAASPSLFDARRPGPAPAAAAPRVVSTDSRVLFQVLDGVFAGLGFGALGDEVFRDLVLARVVEPTSILDAGRVLADLGRKAASDKTMRRTLARCADRGYRGRIAELCFAHARASGDVSLILYDVTTLYFEAEHEDALRKAGYSKERRVDPQIVVGLLVDRHGFPLEIGCFEGNQAEKLTILPVIRQFQARHGIEVVVGDAGMLSAANLADLDEAGLGSSSDRGLPRPRSTCSRTSAGTATPSATGRSSTPSLRRPGRTRTTTPPCGPSPPGTARTTRSPGGRSGRSPRSGSRGTTGPSPRRRTAPATSSAARSPPARPGSSGTPTGPRPSTKKPSPARGSWPG